MKLQKLRQLLSEWRGVLITVPTVALLVIALRGIGLLQLLELATLDSFFRWRPQEPTDSRILLVEITETDIKKLRQWPISDRKLAELLLKIKKFQPRVIGLDIYRDLPVEPGGKELVSLFETTPNLIGITKIGNEKNSVAPPPTLDKLNQVAASDIPFDADGKVRRAFISLEKQKNKSISSLGAELADRYLEKQGINFEAIDNNLSIYKLGKAEVYPLTENYGGYINLDSGGYQVLLNFRSHKCRGKKQQKDCRIFETVSISDVLKNQVSGELIRDRVVLIGSNAESVKDSFFTPYSFNILEPTPGVEIHAELSSQLISAALDGRALIKSWSEECEICLIGVFSAVGAILGFHLLRIRWKIISILLVGVSIVGSSYIAFLFGWWIPVIPSLLALICSEVGITAYINYIERQDRLTVMTLLGQHVSPKIAQAVWSDRHQLLREGQLLGQKMTATVLFTDIKGFTTITEKTEPETLMFWLNDYMKVMSQVVIDNDGVVDKFIGDAVMAVFGVPIPRTTEKEIAQDAIAAVNCAVEMGEKLQQLNQQWQEKQLPVVMMRVGIATGTVVAGSLGSRQRLNYTTIGDTVNIAARLESYDKSLESNICRILISGQTYEYIKDKFTTEFIGSVQLKGREQSVDVYQVLGKNSNAK
ncbi:CHASE2 domain-containing protein [Aerosakkonemataceae cyanobacterium BLCC-F50]|uniref:CHASE2 domain-containing protein n=1 Tax=Floridaenema flaviceps BLCC-F50 TaxID=3153642 RepID=A0ABV4XUM2_9CYAN